MDENFVALVRGPSTRYPRGFPLLFPVWLAAGLAAAWIAWIRVIGPMQWWYRDTLVVGMLIAAVTVVAVVATIRMPAFRADRNGIRLGLRTERKRPRHRQAHLWWSDVRQLRIEPRRYGTLVEISLGPAARIVRRRGPIRQTLLWCTLLVMPFGLGRGTPRLTEPGRKDPQYRIRLYDVTPEELGLALAGLALPAVEIIVISRRYGPIMARRPQPAAPRNPAPAAPAAPPAAPAAPPAPSAAPAPSPAPSAPPAAPAPATASAPADPALAGPAATDPAPAAGDTPADPVGAATATVPEAEPADPAPAAPRPREASQPVPLIVAAPVNLDDPAGPNDLAGLNGTGGLDGSADLEDEAPAVREASQPAA